MVSHNCNNPVDLTDREIIEGCLKSDRECEQLLYERFAPKMFALCLRYARNRMEAEDIMQNGFIRVYNKLHTFKHKGSFEGWIRRIMVHSAIKFLKKSSNKNEFSTLEDVKEKKVESKAVENISEAELLELINSMPDGYKVVFNLYVIEGYKHSEIADMLEIQESTSRSQLLKARKFLQDALKNLQLILI